MQGLWESAFAKLSGNNSTLKIFPKSFRRENHLRKNIGLNTIRVNEIVGTLNRRSDFDYKFRPLRKHLLDRWIDTYLSLNRDGWSPILVHKIGNEYYVEDGHHRVSIAWSMGMVYIEAIVWEYCQDTQPKNNCLPHSHVERSCIRVYATR
jgi:hypothetical protein